MWSSSSVRATAEPQAGSVPPGHGSSSVCPNPWARSPWLTVCARSQSSRPSFCELGHRPRRQPVAAGLVAREDRRVGQQHLEPRPAPPTPPPPPPRARHRRRARRSARARSRSPGDSLRATAPGRNHAPGPSSAMPVPRAGDRGTRHGEAKVTSPRRMRHRRARFTTQTSWTIAFRPVHRDSPRRFGCRSTLRATTSSRTHRTKRARSSSETAAAIRSSSSSRMGGRRSRGYHPTATDSSSATCASPASQVHAKHVVEVPRPVAVGVASPDRPPPPTPAGRPGSRRRPPRAPPAGRPRPAPRAGRRSRSSASTGGCRTAARAAAPRRGVPPR